MKPFTQTPWEHYGTLIHSGELTLGKIHNPLNAKFAVHAVNAYDTLLHALRVCYVDAVNLGMPPGSPTAKMIQEALALGGDDLTDRAREDWRAIRKVLDENDPA
jgi:hypothetical protein